MSEDNFDDEFDGSFFSGLCYLMVCCFCGYLLVVVDVEIGGFNLVIDVLLEIVVIIVGMDEKGFLFLEYIYFFCIEFFEGVNIELVVLEFIGIKFDYLLCMVVQEEVVFIEIFCGICKVLKVNGCKWVILVGYNSSFDFGFFNVVVVCIGIKCNLFYFFFSFDIVILVGFVYGQMVLVKVCQVVGMEFDNCEVYLVCYDIEKIVELFCGIVNCWKEMGGWMDDDD